MARRLLVKERVLNCFERFKNGDFDIEDGHGMVNASNTFDSSFVPGSVLMILSEQNGISIS